MTTPQTCKAYKYHKRGDPSKVVELDEHHPVPTPVTGQLLVKVKAAAINPVDWKLMKYMPLGARSPLVANDYSGTVVKSESSEFSVGDEVYGIVDATLKIRRGMGTLAQFIVAPAETCAKRPAGLDAVDAAGLTLVGSTALSLSEVVDTKRREGARVLVCGGSSGVGLMLIPILRNMGCNVAATCSAAKSDIVKKRGAQTTFDYRSADFQQTLKQHAQKEGRFDYILDCVDSFDVWRTTPVTLTKEGSFASVGFDASDGLLPAVRRAIAYFLQPAWLGGVSTKFNRPAAKSTYERTKELARLVDGGVLTPVVDSRFEFDQVKEAFKQLQTNRATGKVIIRVQ